MVEIYLCLNTGVVNSHREVFMNRVSYESSEHYFKTKKTDLMMNFLLVKIKLLKNNETSMSGLKDT